MCSKKCSLVKMVSTKELYSSSLSRRRHCTVTKVGNVSGEAATLARVQWLPGANKFPHTVVETDSLWGGNLQRKLVAKRASGSLGSRV